MRPNSKYLVAANTVAIAPGTFIEGVTEEGDCFALTRDIEGLKAYAEECGYGSLEEMLTELFVKAEELIDVPFLIYGTDRVCIAHFARDGLVAVFNDAEDQPADFWPSAA